MPAVLAGAEMRPRTAGSPGRRMVSEAGLRSDERRFKRSEKEGGRSDIREFSLKTTPAEGTPFSREPRKRGDEHV